MKEKKIYMERFEAAWSEDSLIMIETPGHFTRSTYFFIQEAGHFKTDDRYFTERQNMHSFLIIYTLSGTGSLSYEGKLHLLKPGDCFFINCMNHHYYKTAPGQNWEFLWLHFNGNSAMGYYEEFVRNGFQIVSSDTADSCKTILENILSINKQKNISTDILISQQITNLLTKLLLYTITKQNEQLQMPEYIFTVLYEMDQNFQQPLPLTYLAELANISKFHLAKEFKRYMGTPINEYLINIRLSHAKELLKYTQLPVSEVAYESGFNQPSHFIQIFKAREGLTPLAYRKEWR